MGKTGLFPQEAALSPNPLSSVFLPCGKNKPAEDYCPLHAAKCSPSWQGWEVVTDFYELASSRVSGSPRKNISKKRIDHLAIRKTWKEKDFIKKKKKK